MKYATYNEFGQITCCGTAPAEMQSELTNIYTLIVFLADDVYFNDVTHYVNIAAPYTVTPFPDKTTPYDTWNWSTLVWDTPSGLLGKQQGGRKGEVEFLRDQKLLAGVTYSGETYACDDASRVAYSIAHMMYTGYGDIPPKLTVSGRTEYIASGSLGSIIAAMNTYTGAVLTNAAALNSAIDNAADATALAAIDLTVGWP